MLRVKTYLDKSEVQGIGLFAGEDIDEGRVVWEFSPHLDLVFDPAQWARLCSRCSPESLGQLRKYSYKEGQRYYICFDNAQFMNHGQDNPNVRSGKSSFINVAARDIRMGEELFCDYAEYCDADDYNMKIINRLRQA